MGFTATHGTLERLLCSYDYQFRQRMAVDHFINLLSHPLQTLLKSWADNLIPAPVHLLLFALINRLNPGTVTEETAGEWKGTEDGRKAFLHENVL